MLGHGMPGTLVASAVGPVQWECWQGRRAPHRSVPRGLGARLYSWAGWIPGRLGFHAGPRVEKG